MKKAAIAGIAALTLLDISAATPVAAQNASAFQGGYVGAHAGGATTNNMSFTSVPYDPVLPSGTNANIILGGRNDKFDFNSALAGVHSGFNFVTPGNFLFGIEGDWSLLNDSDSVNFNSGVIATGGGDSAIFQHRSEVDLEWQGTIRGRAGFIAGNALFFATAGIAFLNAEWKERATLLDCGANGCGNANDVTITQNHSDSSTLTGAVVGAGVEFAITPNIIVGGDYLYETFNGFGGGVPFGHASPGITGNLGDLDVHKVRVRVSVKFGGPAQ